MHGGCTHGHGRGHAAHPMHEPGHHAGHHAGTRALMLVAVKRPRRVRVGRRHAWERGHSGQRGHAPVEMSAHAHAAHVHHPSPAPPLAPTPAAAPAAHPSAPPAVETPEPAAVPAVVLRPALRRRLDLHRGPRERVEGRSPLRAAHAVLAHGFAVRERGES